MNNYYNKSTIKIVTSNGKQHTYELSKYDIKDLIKIINRFYLTNELLEENYINEDIEITDSEGNSLSKEQIDFFKDSKVRDDKGNLLVVYHGTGSSFDTFDKGDIGFHFGTKGQAEFVTREREFKDPHVNAFYLNIKNPCKMYDFGNNGPYNIAFNWWSQSYEPYNYENLFEFNMTQEELDKINKVFLASGGCTFGTGNEDTDITAEM